MLTDLLDSLARPGSYRRFAAQKASRAAAYVAFLSILFVASLTVSVKLRVAPRFTRTFAWLAESMPPLRFSGGVLTSEAPGPTVVRHPDAPELALLIDTSREGPVTADELKKDNLTAAVTAKALYLRQGEAVQPFPFERAAADPPARIDASTYRDMEKAFNWIFYPSFLLMAFLVYACYVATFALAFALAGLVIASAARARLDFASLLKMSIHAQSAATVMFAALMLLPLRVPAFLLQFVLGLAYLVLAIRAAARAQAAPPPAA